MTKNVKIKEIFASIQGEGPFIGYKQLFIRFCGCNLKCKYCDTDFNDLNSTFYAVEDLLKIINSNNDCHSISLTGGEPLLQANFLKELLPQSTLPVYLENNETLPDELEKIINNIDYISADIKLPSCAGNSQLFNVHDKFFDIAKNKTLFAKIVFNKNITDDEILRTAELGLKYNIELILQPMNNGNKMFNDSKFIEHLHNKYLKLYNKVRVIPQTHKYLNLQ